MQATPIRLRGGVARALCAPLLAGLLAAGGGSAHALAEPACPRGAVAEFAAGHYLGHAANAAVRAHAVPNRTGIAWRVAAGTDGSERGFDRTSGAGYRFRVSFESAGVATLRVLDPDSPDGLPALVSLAHGERDSPRALGNALRIVVEGSGALEDAAFAVTIGAVNGHALGRSLQVSGAPARHELVLASDALQPGVELEGMIRVDGWPGSGGGSFELSIETGAVSCRPPHLQAIGPALLSLQAGALGRFAITLDRAAETDTPVTVSSSAPAVAALPSSTVTIARGTRQAWLPVQAGAPGTARIVASWDGHTREARAHVLTGAPLATHFEPRGYALAPGASGELVLRADRVAAADTPVDLTLAAPPGSLAVPARVILPAGRDQVRIPVHAGSTPAHATIDATLAGASVRGYASTLEAAPQPRLALVAGPGHEQSSASLEVDAPIRLRVRLSAVQPSDTVVALSAEPALPFAFPATVIVPAGQIESLVVVTARAAGQATLRARSNAVSASVTLDAGVAPPELALLPAGLRVLPGAPAMLALSAGPAAALPRTVALRSAGATALEVPAAIIVPAGETVVDIPLGTAGSGSASIEARVGALTRVLPVAVAFHTATLPSFVTSGSQGMLRDRLGARDANPTGTTVPLGTRHLLLVGAGDASAEPTVLELRGTNGLPVPGVPPRVVVPPGQTRVFVEVLGAVPGSHPLQARPPGGAPSTRVFTLTVGPPVASGLSVQPASAVLEPGGQQPLAVRLHRSDLGSVVVTGLATHASSATAIASVSASGLARALAPGMALVTARLDASRTGQGPVYEAAARITVGAPPVSLAVSGPATLALGASGAYTVSRPTPAPAGGVWVHLGAISQAQVEIPAAVFIAPGQSQAGFRVRGLAPGHKTLVVSARGHAESALPIEVVAPQPPPAITGIAPAAGPAGTTVTIDGSGFGATPADNRVTFTGAAPVIPDTATATRLTVTVPESAQTGPVTVRSPAGGATGPVYTVTPREFDFGVTAMPAAVVLPAGSSATATVQAASLGVQAYTGLVTLSASGLPAGVGARFEPPLLAAGQPGLLRLSATASAAPGTYPIVVRASATVGGATLLRTAQFSLHVQPSAGVTGASGRFVTPEGMPIAGVRVAVQDAKGAVLAQTATDAAGAFLLTGLPAGEQTLRFDATPAHPLYPIWPLTLALAANEIAALGDLVIAPPPPAERYTAIATAGGAQVITDARYPGLAIRLPAGVSILGWDGVPKTRIAVEKIELGNLPVPPPPVPVGDTYQLYFGTPMGGVPSAPIPMTLPNDSGAQPGEAVDVWFFDGSPMGGSGEWKIAGQGIVSADGTQVVMPDGTGIPRFCGVCGLVCLAKRFAQSVYERPKQTCPAGSANPIEYATGQEVPRASGLACGGLAPVDTGLSYSPVDAFDGVGGVYASFGLGWTSDYDVVVLPFAGPQKRVILPGNRPVDLVDRGGGLYRSGDDPRLEGAVLRQTASERWELELRGGVRWVFAPYAAVLQRGSPPYYLIEIIDARGNSTAITRRSDGRIVSVGRPGRTIDFLYGANGFVAETRDALGRSNRYTYTATNRIETHTDAEGRVTRYGYANDSEYPVPAVCAALAPGGERIVSIASPGRARALENFHGAGRRVLRQIDAGGVETRFDYTLAGACVVHRSAPAVRCTGAACPAQESWEQHEAGWRFYGGRVIATTVRHADGTSEHYRFNASGVVTEHRDRAGQRTRYTLDAANRVSAEVDALGRRWRYEYDSAGNRSAIFDAAGRLTRIEHHARWALPVRITREDPAGGPAQVWTFDYEAGRALLTRATDPLGARTEYGYGARGELVSVRTALGALTRFDYDAAGDLAGITDALGQRTALGSDGAGRLTSITDALGHTTRRELDATDRLRRVIDALGGVTHYAYDGAGRFTSLTDALGQPVERRRHDDGDRLIARTDAAGAETRFDYDGAGRLDRVTDRAGRVTRYRYDGAGRLAEIERPEGVTRLGYDALGRLVRLDEPHASIDFAWDGLDRLVREVQRTAGGQTVIDYVYDAYDRRIRRTVSEAGAAAQVTEYVWDLGNRLLEVRFQGQATRQSWDAEGRLVERIDPSGLRSRYAYDAAGRVRSVAFLRGDLSEIERIDYGYDAAGRRTSRTSTPARATPEATRFEAGYDAAHRLVRLTLAATATRAERRYTLGYDASGNLVSRTPDDGSPGIAYRWDSRNRLVSIDGPGVVARFVYDALDRRIERTVNAQSTSYVYDGLQAIAESTPAGRTAILTGLALDEVLALYAPSGQRTLLTDALGSVLALADEQHSLRTRYAYSPYGQTMAWGEAHPNSLQYTARENDATGLYFYRARYYDPVLGRFISEDPIGIAGGVNLYAYASGDPILRSDALGLADVVFSRTAGPVVSGLFEARRPQRQC